MRSGRLDILKETSTIVLHSKRLQLDAIQLTTDSDVQTTLAPSAVTFDASNDRSSIVLTHPLPARSKAQLRISFAGELTPNLVGYYYSLSSAVDGRAPKHYSLTQFEVRFIRLLRVQSSLDRRVAAVISLRMRGGHFPAGTSRC